MTETRLRSETKTSATRIARVRENRVTAEREREEIAADFRAKLLAELGVDVLSASQSALLDAATSAYLEVTVFSARFLRCSATDEQMSRLSAARAQVTRALKMLGLPKVEDAATPSGQTVEDLRREYAERGAAR